MKKTIILVIFLMFTGVIFAQSPQSFQYQAVVRDASGVALVNQPVNFQISIIEGVLPGTVIYVETHTSTTNTFGIVTLSVGSGIPVTNLFSDIDWSITPHFIKVEADPIGGTSYINMGITQLLSVPYALYAENAGNAGQTYTSGTGINITGNVISNTDPGSAINLTQGGSTTITGTYPNFTISSTDNNTTYTSGNGINIIGTTITNTLPDQTVTLSQGGATTITGTYPNYTISSIDNNSGTPGGVDGSVQYNTGGIFGGNSSFIWDNSNNRLGVGLNNPNGRVVIQGSATAPASEPLFEIKNRNGQSIMVVYEDSIHFFITDIGSNQGGFAVSGRSNAKAMTNDFMRINADSTRIWTGDTVTGFGVKNIGATSKTSYMQLTPNNYLIGHQAGKSITSGKYNSFIGYQAGYSDTSGNSNYFIGYYSGFNNLSGYSNIFLGDNCGYFNSTGYGNIFLGDHCGYNNTIGMRNVFLGYYAGYTNNGNYNVFLGDHAGFSNTSGWGNTANGYYALYSNTLGINNVANGYQALYFNTGGAGNYNVANGYQALYFNTEGYHVANGYQALYSNTTGTKNTANGYQAMYSNTTGSSNVAEGNSALFSNTTGNSNVAIGDQAMYYATGFTNTSIGRWSLFYNTGDNNTALGFGAFFSAVPTSYTNSTAIGNSASISASNQVKLGNTSVTSFYCQGAYAATTALAANMYVSAAGQIMRSTSSKRYKKDIENIKINTEDIYKLRPVSYISIMDNKPYFGLIAEEVAEIIPGLTEFAKEKDVIKGSDSEKLIPDAVQYPMLSVLLLNEMQKHQKKINELNTKNEELKKIINIVQKENTSLKNDNNILKTKVLEIDKLNVEYQNMKSDIEKIKMQLQKR